MKEQFDHYYENLKMCQFTTRVNNDTRRKLTLISRKTDVPISAILRKLIIDFLEAEPQKQITNATILRQNSGPGSTNRD